ncbi:MAG: alpha/beta fold hydrolase [Woeseiaceae bacterium]|nr:alpha/beta fold hydrolase [Woeseiaceae bacterium]
MVYDALAMVLTIGRITAVVLCALGLSAAAEQRYANIGNLPLTSGQIVRDCKIGYRAYGTLNGERSNVIVFPTWFGGTTADLEAFGKIGPGALADTDRYYVVTIDALGNGVSCSPSNSETTDGGPIETLSIDDMVRSQHALLTSHLGIANAHAVMGISMGGMQTFRWLSMYPDFMDKAVAIDGTPRQTSYDLLQWDTHKHIVRALQAGGFSDADISVLKSRLTLLTLYTPAYFVETVPADAVDEFLRPQLVASPSFRADDYVAQLEAMMTHDVIGDAGVASYAGRIAAELLVVGTQSDQMVNPVPARELAAALGARYVEIRSHCGHIGSSCEADTVVSRVAEFLAD